MLSLTQDIVFEYDVTAKEIYYSENFERKFGYQIPVTGFPDSLFEANIIYPRVVGGAVGISGLYVLLSLVIFGNLFGFFGLLIAVPSMALIYAVGSRVVNISLYRKHIEITDKTIKKFDE